MDVKLDANLQNALFQRSYQIKEYEGNRRASSMNRFFFDLLLVMKHWVD